MEFRNTSIKEMEKALRVINHAYAGNIILLNPEVVGVRVKRIKSRLSVKSSKETGGRRGVSGKRVHAACWHAHRDFMVALFGLNPDVEIKSAMATYKGKDDFEVKHHNTNFQNIGQGQSYGSACDC